MCYSKLRTVDHEFLHRFGGVTKNSFVNQIDPYPEEREKTNEPVIIDHSSYYELKDVIPLLKKHKSQFSILSTNIRSISSKIDELRIFVKKLHDHNVEFSAICIQEAWMSEGADISQIQIEGYTLIPQGYSAITTDKGGLLIYLNERFDYSNKMKLNYFHNWEGQVIQVKKGDHLAKPVIIANIYRRPLETNDYYKEFIEQFTPFVKQLESGNTDTAITGDFNIDLLDINKRQIYGEYFDMLTDNSFFPKITLPTRLDKYSATLIDNIFCKLTENTLHTTSGILTKVFSDHQPYFTFIDNTVTKDISPKYITINKQDEESLNNFRNALDNKLNDHKFENSFDSDPNLNYNSLHEIIQDAKDKFMPSIKVKFNKYKHKKNQWITKEIMDLIKKRDDKYQLHKMTDQNSELYNIQKEVLKLLNSDIKKKIRQSKKNYYSQLFQKLKHDIKGTWQNISMLLNKTKNKKKFPSFFRDDDNNIISDKVQIANKFNTFFATIGSNLASKIKKQNKSFKDYLLAPNHPLFKFCNIDETKIDTIIKDLAPKTSFGFDGISSKLVKYIRLSLLKPITLIINQMLHTGIFPNKLKIAKINPIYKKGDENLFTNYRPISLLPTLSKIFEKVVFQQVYNHFQEKKLFFNAQYGFRTGHSIEFAAIELIDKIISRMDKMETPIGIFLDLSKAFDTLDHDILLQKLKYYGFNDIALKLMHSYLNNRKQYVQIEEANSDFLSVTTGVPQGSVLGPLLFIIYMNDISNASTLFEFILYADDTSLTTTVEIIIREGNIYDLQARINSELSKINEWLKVNRLSLNITKTKYMMFHMHNKNVPQIELKIDDVVIEQVSEFNFLGITISEDLKWKKHIDKISNRISRNIGVLNKLKHYLPVPTKLSIYNSLILSHINFGLLIWGYSCERILKLQKKSVRIICLSKYNAHTDPIFKQLEILKVGDIFTLQTLKFYYRFKNGQLPAYSLSLPFPQNLDMHDYETRNRQQLHPDRPVHVYASKTIRYNLPYIVNNTPHDVLDKIGTHGLKGFSGYVKHYLLDSYQTVCVIPNCYVCSS